jgi:metal-responsive CopG/Arc/MetJ family transcriptional regulator
MKVKTSVTLSEELLNAISAETGESNRSAFIEEATWRYLRLRERQIRDRAELDRINENVDDLNAEAFDVLEYQDDE